MGVCLCWGYFQLTGFPKRHFGNKEAKFSLQAAYHTCCPVNKVAKGIESKEFNIENNPVALSFLDMPTDSYCKECHTLYTGSDIRSKIKTSIKYSDTACNKLFIFRPQWSAMSIRLTATNEVAWSVGLPWSRVLQKWLKRSKCHLGCGLGWVRGSTY